MFGTGREKDSQVLSRRTAQRNARQRPPRQEIAETMRRVPPSRLPNTEILRVVYSADGERRLLITRNSVSGCFQYAVERLYVWSDEEWLFLTQFLDALPAMWERTGDGETSFFGTEQEAWNALTCAPEYRRCFGKEPRAFDGALL